MKKRVVSLFLTMVLTMMMVAPVSAVDKENRVVVDSEDVFVLEDGSTIKSYVMENGDIYLRQYVNEQLLEEVFIAQGSTEVISTRYQNATETVEVLDSNECIVVHTQTETQTKPKNSAKASLVTKGRITFENTSGRHVAKVQYSSNYDGITTYTIISGTYTVVQLAGLLVAGLGVTNVIASEVACTIFNRLGLATTAAGMIMSNKTYAAKLTTYTYYLTDNATNFTNTMQSKKYVINDTNANNYNNQTFWVGIDPAKCWKNISFGEEVYWHLYGDMSWSIVSWS